MAFRDHILLGIPANLLVARVCLQRDATNIRDQIRLFTDIDLYLLIVSGICGDVAMFPIFCAVDNNPLIPDRYDVTKTKSYKLYMDCNNISGLSVPQSFS